METGKDSRCRGKIERIRVPLYFREEEDGGKRAYTHGDTFADLQNREREARKARRRTRKE